MFTPFIDILRPKWKHGNWSLRRAAVEKLMDQALLADSAKHDKNCLVRYAAANRLSDQLLLAEVSLFAEWGMIFDYDSEDARLCSEPDAGYVAIERLWDPALLADIAKRASSGAVGRAAQKKLQALAAPH
jgi:hypothetical protein